MVSSLQCLHTVLFYCILIILLFQTLDSQEETAESQNENDDVTNDINVIEEGLDNTKATNTTETLINEEGEGEGEEEQVIDANLEQFYTLLRRMYSSITHGDSRYFNMVIKELQNDTLIEYLDDENVMEAIETNFVHILNTMHLVSEIAVKIHATPMYVLCVYFFSISCKVNNYFSGK